MFSSFAIQRLIITQNIYFYTAVIIFVVGIIGNILNIFIFTKVKIFQGNRCAFYLIVESIINLCFLIQIFVPQIYQRIYGIDPGNISIFYCKIRTTLGQSCRLLIDFIVCFEALDQYLTTHYHFSIRKISTLNLAQCLIIVATTLCISQTIPYIIFYDIVTPFGCIITNKGLTYYYSYVYYIFVHGFFPILISSLFSVLAYRNVRHLIRRQIPIVRRKLDRQLTAMIFVRVIFFIILLLPYTIFRIYILNLNISLVDTVHYAILQLTSAITVSLMLGNHSVNFYIFFATSSRFRHQVKYFFMKICWQSLKRWYNSNINRVHPMNISSTASSATSE
ncbi:unnamed protein product [Rotaria sp. Silwood2]|nr:unnamed protein product [Rotaria sp. Silwood2]CAF4126804.1 unnamed protein product [Rotaria sp. Silwood2]